MATALVLWLQFFAFLAYIAIAPQLQAVRAVRAFRSAARCATIFALLRLGVPMGVSVLMEASLFVATALLIGSLGADVVAGHQIAINVASVAFMLPLGVAMATTVRVGLAVGRGDARRRALCRLRRHRDMPGHAGVFVRRDGAAAACDREPLHRRCERRVAFRAQLLILAAIFQFSDGIQVTANGALRGLKDTTIPMIITTVAYWGIGMPVGWWLAFRHGMGARGMWIGLDRRA